MVKRFLCFIILLAVFSLIFLPSSQGAAKGEGLKKNQKGEAIVRLGMLPIIDNLPFWVAQNKGYFQDEGIAAELIYFPSAVERDSAFTAHRIDAAIGDLLAVAALHDAGIKLKAVSVAMGAKAGESRFAVLSAPDSKIRTPEQLKNVEIAVSLNSIIEYSTDRLLQHKGLKSAEIKKVSVPKMPVRLESLLQGTLKAATLPDPLATLAIIKGAHVIADTMNDNVSKTVIIVRENLLADNLPAVKKLIAVYGRAIADINANPSGFNELLAKQARVPLEVLNSTVVKMPLKFSSPQLPSRNDVLDVLAWMKERNLLKKPIKYEDLVAEAVRQ
ncbi:MAG: MetQ/NlpA family ABC transporter substrate-binding protein [Syntrophales bacterium]|jgi:NitT/TauT family transport system substrate-binding protein|nr:MetQ/NlpA family ABC transporter substrate-binding protein [Syntrophales bacterium]